MPGTRIDVAGRGNNHAGAAASIAARLSAALLALVLVLGGPARAQDDPTVQRGVPAEATAENAVVARDRALASGQRIAYERMAAAMGLPTGLSDSQIQGMVRSLVIESERVTPRGYSARITVNFNAGRARASGEAAAGAAGGASSPARRGPAVATVEAVALYRSFPEWVEINRRLAAAGPVARTEVLSVSGDRARLRLALRAQPIDAATEFAESGLDLAQGTMDARPGEAWRLTLAGGR